MNRTALSIILCAPMCAGGIPSDKGYHAAEMRRYYQDIEERTSPEQKAVNA